VTREEKEEVLGENYFGDSFVFFILYFYFNFHSEGLRNCRKSVTSMPTPFRAINSSQGRDKTALEL
jgi:hypothetical protein